MTNIKGMCLELYRHAKEQPERCACEFIVATLILTIPVWVPVCASVLLDQPYSVWGL